MLVMADYTPSPKAAAARAAYLESKTKLEEDRLALRAAIAEDMKTFDVAADTVAKQMPWTPVTIRSIADEYGIPMKRKPTVRSIRPKRRGKEE